MEDATRIKFLLILIVTKEYSCVSNLLYAYSKLESYDTREMKLSNFLYYLTIEYLNKCTPYLLYDEFFYETVIYREILLQSFNYLRQVSFAHSFVDKFTLIGIQSSKGRQNCYNFIVFAVDMELILAKLDFQLTSRVVLVSTMSRWMLNDFLSSEFARNIQNLLIVSDPLLQKDDYYKMSSKKSNNLHPTDINLFTHELHMDGIGSSALKILTAWRNNSLTRNVNLFPPKLDRGLNGHRILVSAFEQPPFVMRRKKNVIQSDHIDAWDGLEVRLLRMIATSLNISLTIRDTMSSGEKAASDEVIAVVHKGIADIGISGLHITRKNYERVYFSLSHSQDCASFITLSSTALPKYRAILGPFRWSVWLCVIFLYLLAIVPISFSNKLSCRMFEGWDEVGTMFWIVFGTYTNLFTYKGEESWNNIKKSSTRTVIGTYWIFTIIMTAAYSSSIISFITVPTYFDVVDSVADLLEEDFHIGTLDSRDWTSFNNTFDIKTNKLLKQVEILNATIMGLEKVRKNKKFAFLGSKTSLSYIVRSDFSLGSSKMKSLYHLTSQCLAPLMVGFVMKPKSDFLIKFDQQIQRFHENGLIEKIMKDIDWEVGRLSGGKLFVTATGALQSDTYEDRQLTVDDMQGMFLLLGIGLIMASSALFNECFKGYQCWDDMKSIGSKRTPIPSIVLTPCADEFGHSVTLSRRASDFSIRAISAGSAHIEKRVRESLRRFSH